MEGVPNLLSQLVTLRYQANHQEFCFYKVSLAFWKGNKAWGLTARF